MPLLLMPLPIDYFLLPLFHIFFAFQYGLFLRHFHIDIFFLLLIFS